MRSAEDIAFIINAVPSVSNGLTLCTGSLGAGTGNDLTAITQCFAPHIHFAHLRNVAKDDDGSFMEAEHLGGDVSMVEVVGVLLGEERRRQAATEQDWRIPFCPDHGLKLLDDVHKNAHPGYPAIGRLRGLAELRGVIAALSVEKIDCARWLIRQRRPSFTWKAAWLRQWLPRCYLHTDGPRHCPQIPHKLGSPQMGARI